MDTVKMVTELKTACATLEKNKAELVAKIKAIDDKLTGYRMAIDALELTSSACGTTEPVNHCRKGKEATPIEFNGETLTIPEWAEKTGVNIKTLYGRIRRGWPLAEALKPDTTYRKKPVRRRRSKKVFAYDAHGNVVRQFIGGVGEAARLLNLPESTVKKIIANTTKEDQLRVRNYYLAYAT